MIATLIVLSAAAYVYFEHGFVSTRADTKPGILDRWLSQAIESSIERHPLKTTDPELDTPQTLIAAARVYGTRCAVCHGNPAQQENQIGEAENPPAPQFFSGSPPEMTESQNDYLIKHGIRMTALLPGTICSPTSKSGRLWTC